MIPPKVNLVEESSRLAELFVYKRIGTVGNQMLNILHAEDRALDFHIHEDADELFYIIEGEMDMEFAEGLQHLQTGELIIVPAGVLHRPVVKEWVTCLLIETEGTLDESNTGGSYK